jgi:hypothetical protein
VVQDVLVIVVVIVVAGFVVVIVAIVIVVVEFGIGVVGIVTVGVVVGVAVAVGVGVETVGTRGSMKSCKPVRYMRMTGERRKIKECSRCEEEASTRTDVTKQKRIGSKRTW